MGQHPQYDIAVAGGGPAGLAFVRSLAGTGLRIAVVDGQHWDALERPAFDGREIALTHRSMSLLKRMGVWDCIDPEDVSDLRAARVMDGGDPYALSFVADEAGRLGVLIPNHRIREALFHLVGAQQGVDFVPGRRIVRARVARSGHAPFRGRLELDDGTEIAARLLVAADSRFSSVRNQLGVGADINRLGRSMILCRVRHDHVHDHVATEWFDYGQTLALLPLNGMERDARTSSAVLTLPTRQAEELAALPDAEFERELDRRMKGRLGTVRLAGSRHLYPLAVTWSRRFAGEGFALIGDAAVGMNPVTAHGFNLGLKGQDRLAGLIRQAAALGRGIGAYALLAGYEAGHRRDALPLYLGTNIVARLFTDEGPAARIARRVALRAAQSMTPFRHAVRAMLTDPG
ncbi:5-demethoxyubiquinol-8 5-hydroxylase UbiM [Arenibaculum pallidiluteum]|uniref:5-demethoxyubiquinol-8 5-hydroxylase UbiM n=1 Tax=Arenibaculum pallidiluteum TaxID=2812559 RepID=UPI001A97690D|nr:5-demethoxyubiquinol-8 5-hydroxylase UbiM [Arenibaculum pallidiluteum]